MPKTHLLLAAALLLWLGIVSAARDAHDHTSPISSDECEVFAGAIDFFEQSRIASHPLVADHTSTFECTSGCNGMSMGGCNGLRLADENPDERLRIVKGDLPDAEEVTLTDFKGKNQHCTEITGKIPAKSESFPFNPSHGPQLPPGWEHPDFFYFSRVAFNSKHTQALVHISFMSGTDSRYSGGKYFLFVARKGGWKLLGTSAVWQLDAREAAPR